MKTRLASLLVLMAATPVFAQPSEHPPVYGTDGTVIVITPAPVVVSGASQVAPAPPAVAAVALPAPQNEPWTNVSHINGQLVPVGQRGDYTYKWKKTNVATNPIGWMFGFYGISVSHAVSNNIALRGDVNIISFEDTSGYEIGASAVIYFKRVFNGPFLEPGIIARDFRNTNCDYDCSSDGMIGPEVLFGWHWTFDSGLNVALAIGAAKPLKQEDKMDEYDSSEDVQPAGYFRIGYAF